MHTKTLSQTQINTLTLCGLDHLLDATTETDRFTKTLMTTIGELSALCDVNTDARHHMAVLLDILNTHQT